MLAILGFGMIVTFMVLIMTKRMSAIAALIVIPIVFGLLAGYTTELGRMAIEGMMELAPTVVALVFAVLYFSIMIDAGLFDPLVNRALAFAMLINYPRLSDQRDRISAHAGNALPIALLIFAAAVFTGILNGTGMVDAMGETLLALIPEGLGPYMGALVAATSGPLTFIMSNDAYYFGIVPVLAESAGHFGVTPVEVARASLLGQCLHALSPLIASIYLVAGLLGVEVGDLQRFGLPFALALNVLMVAAALAIGVVPFIAS